VDVLSNPDAWVALLTLTSLEIVLGIDNVVFISILADRLPPEQRRKARLVGLSLAMFMRIALLLAINWIANLTDTLATIPVIDQDLSGRDLILLAGGLFLIYKSVTEIHGKLEGEEHGTSGRAGATFTAVIIQILLLDIVFSLDSVITAVGMAEDIEVMITAVVIAVIVMLVASGPLSEFVSKHPTVKMVALSFLLLIGMTLVAEGWGMHIPKGYIYSAMAFAVFVEILNLRSKSPSKPVDLHEPRLERVRSAAETVTDPAR
jgi:predicted tellurium resistance membrane protein TerC